MIISPHSAFYTGETIRHMIRNIFKNLHDLETGVENPYELTTFAAETGIEKGGATNKPHPLK